MTTPLPGEPFLALISGTVDAEYDRLDLRIAVRLPGGEFAYVPREAEGVTFLPGDVLVGALKDAVAMREPDDGCPSCEFRPDGRCEPCAGDARRRNEYGEVLAALKAAGGAS